MANKVRAKMPASERAKQFMPFAAVKGLDEALERKRRELTRFPKAELSEERSAHLNAMLLSLRKGMTVAVTHYVDGEYQTLTGTLERIDAIARELRVGGRTMAFEDMWKVEILP